MCIYRHGRLGIIYLFVIILLLFLCLHIHLFGWLHLTTTSTHMNLDTWTHAMTWSWMKTSYHTINDNNINMQQHATTTSTATTTTTPTTINEPMVTFVQVEPSTSPVTTPTHSTSHIHTRIPINAISSNSSCSISSRRAISWYEYETCPVKNINYDTLPNIYTITDGIPSSFQTISTYNPSYPTQVFHNICISGERDQTWHMLVIRNISSPEWVSSLAGQPSIKDPLDVWFPNKNGPEVWGNWRWRGHQYRWQVIPQAESTWKYIHGTTTHVHAHIAGNWGHFIVDQFWHHIMLLSHPESSCVNISYPIDHILVNVGCGLGVDMDMIFSRIDKHNQYDVSSTMEYPPCSLHAAGTSAAEFLLRATIPKQSHAQFITWANIYDKNHVQQCQTLSPICFEHLIIYGRQEDREQRACGYDISREVMIQWRERMFEMVHISVPTLTPIITTTNIQQPRLRVLLYGRVGVWRRNWINWNDTVTVLRVCNPPSCPLLDVHVMSIIPSLFCQQVQAFSEADIIIMPHGAALLSVLFSPIGALVIELFPSVGIDSSWATGVTRSLQQIWKRIDGIPLKKQPQADQRRGPQDYDFNVDPTLIVTQINAWIATRIGTR